MARPKQGREGAICVYTAEPAGDIIARGGSGDWVLNPDKAQRQQYLVCCRKRDWKNMDDGVAERGAFLIGRIKRLIPGKKNPRGQTRFFIEIDRYATVRVPNVWLKWQNPVRYETLDALKIPAGLKFQAVPDATSAPDQNRPLASRGLTIAQAKKELAETFGVRPEDIEITIKG